MQRGARGRALAIGPAGCTLRPPPKAIYILEADVTDQIYPPKRPNMAHFEIPERQTEQDDWKAQLGQLLDDYRNQYVLRQQPGDKPAP